MKYSIALLVACLALAQAQLQLNTEQRARAREHGIACIAQEGTTKEQVKALREGTITNPDQKIKCFANCFLERLGFIADGQPQPDVVLQKLGGVAGNDQVRTIQNACDSLKGEDKCDTAYQLYKCYRKNHAEF